MARALAGLRRYQTAPRPRPPRPVPALATLHGASLRDYGGDGPTLLFVPSLINPPTVLDMPRRSLVKWMRRQGRRVLLVDWGWPDEARRAMSIADHVAHILLPLIGRIGGRVDMAGYCLGATMSLAAAQHAAPRSLALIASPWRFGGFAPAERARLGALWASSRDLAQQLGVLPMEVLQTGFWSLDPARTIAKFEGFADTDPQTARNFVALEDWANDGPPLAAAAARELFEDFFTADRPGEGRWDVGGLRIDPEALACPVLNIVSTTDRIVPHGSAAPVGDRLELARGHVGMVVGSRGRAELWAPFASWLSRVSPA